MQVFTKEEKKRIEETFKKEDKTMGTTKEILSEARSTKDLIMNDYWTVLYEDPSSVLLAIAFGKLSGALLYYDNSQAMLNFIDNQTKYLNEAIQKAENRKKEKDLQSA